MASSKQVINKGGSITGRETNPKTFDEYVTELRVKIEKFKNTQQFVYCYMTERLDLATEMFNGGAIPQAWKIYRMVSAEVHVLLGQYQQPKRTKYFYKGRH